MSWWRTVRRGDDGSSMLPAVATPVAHVIGPGRVEHDNGRIVHVDADGRRQATLLLEGLELVACHGRIEVDSECLSKLAGAGVAVAFLSADGSRLLARITPENDARVLGRVMQHRVLADPALRLRLARSIVAEKIHSQAGAARHYQRQGKRIEGATIDRLVGLGERAGQAVTHAELLGLEGVASAAWYDIFSGLLAKPWTFPRRSRRPPADPANAMLSLGYTFLYHRMVAACQAAGLETGLGALHAYRAGRQSLACDLMEPLRVPVVDRWVIGAINQRRVTPEDFHAVDGAGIRLTKRAFPRVIADWERQWWEGRTSAVVTERVRIFAAEVRKLAGPIERLSHELEHAGIAEIG
jgi:CRISPR-associated protein Cas1